jgi:hypothetical protein
VGARGWSWIAAMLLCLLPVMAVSYLFAKRVLPPTLAFSDDYLIHLKDISGRKY